MVNTDGEIRLVAELDGTPAGIGALVVERSELRACYVHPSVARRGCGSALVREIERLACEHGLSHLELAASLEAEAFYGRPKHTDDPPVILATTIPKSLDCAPENGRPLFARPMRPLLEIASTEPWRRVVA
jgi:GNAT superfamily N-acetyltransferase